MSAFLLCCYNVVVGRLIQMEGVMDKAAIFTYITKRNALRRGNGLPALNFHTEYAHEIAIARQRTYRSFCDDHGDERETIRLEVLAELRLRYGPNFGTGMGGRWMVGRLTHQRFVRHIASK